MKLSNAYLFLVLLFISCNQQKQGINSNTIKDEMVIPKIEKNISDTKFILKNGVFMYENKPFSGLVKEFYLEGNLKSIAQFYKGKRQGFYKSFYPSGGKAFERFYTNGLKSGKHRGWYKDGKNMFEYHFNSNGTYHGIVKDWHANGNLQKHFNFIEGKESGSQKMWDINGKIRANFYTVNGERHGLIGLKKCVSVEKKKNEKS